MPSFSLNYIQQHNICKHLLYFRNSNFSPAYEMNSVLHHQMIDPPQSLSLDSLSSSEHRNRLTHIIDHLVTAQKRAEISGNNSNSVTTFVNEHIKR